MTLKNIKIYLLVFIKNFIYISSVFFYRYINQFLKKLDFLKNMMLKFIILFIYLSLMHHL